MSNRVNTAGNVFLSAHHNISKLVIGLSIVSYGTLMNVANVDAQNNTQNVNAQKSNCINRTYVPEYNQSLEKVIMHATSKINLELETINNFPDYTNIIILTPKNYEPIVKLKINYAHMKNSQNIQIISYDKKYVMFDKWAQDLFKVLQTKKNNKDDASESTIMLPMLPEDMYDMTCLNPDSTMQLLNRHKFQTQNADVYFEGGNIVYDRFDGKNILFVGYSDFMKTMKSIYHTSLAKDSSMILKLFKEQFNADTVIVLGKNQNYTPMFHLDQAFKIIDSGEVFLINADNIKCKDIDEVVDKLRHESYIMEQDYLKINLEETEFLKRNYPDTKFLDSKVRESIFQTKELLREMEKTFEGLGYKIDKYPINLWQAMHYQSYPNAVLFKDKNTNQKNIIMPIFPDDKGEYNSEYKYNKDAITHFKNKGLKVIPIPDHTWKLKGNRHCVMNVYN